MSSVKKRKIECDVADIIEEAVNATVRGIVTEVTLIKNSRNNPAKKYFHAKLSDGRKTVKMIVFDVKLHPQLTKVQQDKTSVEVSNCQVKEASCSTILSPQFELYVNNYSKIKAIPNEFTLPDNAEELDPDVAYQLSNLVEIEDIAVNQHVTVSGKVLKVEAAMQVQAKEGKSLTKQDITISDATKTVRAVLWNDDVGKLEEGQSYELKNVNVKLYGGVKYLSIASNSVIDEITDIGEVSMVSEEDLPPTDNKISGEIIGVQSIEQYKKCIKSCNGKIEQTTATIGRCTKCKAILKLSKCKDNAVVKLLIQESKDDIRTVTAFNDQIVKMIGSHSSDDDLIEKLLSVGTINISVNDKMIVTSIH